MSHRNTKQPSKSPRSATLHATRARIRHALDLAQGAGVPLEQEGPHGGTGEEGGEWRAGEAEESAAQTLDERE